MLSYRLLITCKVHPKSRMKIDAVMQKRIDEDFSRRGHLGVSSCKKNILSVYTILSLQN